MRRKINHTNVAVGKALMQKIASSGTVYMISGHIYSVCREKSKAKKKTWFKANQILIILFLVLQLPPKVILRQSSNTVNNSKQEALERYCSESNPKEADLAKKRTQKEKQ